MNTNFEKFIYPPLEQKHKISVETEGIVVVKPPNEIPNNSNRQIKKPIQILPQSVTLIDEYVGENASLSKIKLNDGTICYVEQFLIEKISIETKNSFPPNLAEENLDFSAARKLDWREQNANTVFEDRKNGKICISYEFPDIIIFDENITLEKKIREAHLLGTTAILKNYNKKHDLQYITQIFDSYYTFSRAEEYFIEARNCSTLKVLITLPKKYLFSKIIENFDGTVDQKDPIANPTQPENKTTYKVITFNNYTSFYSYFTILEKYLRRLNDIYNGRNNWLIEPQSIFLNPNNEANKVKEFFNSVNQLLETNFPNSFAPFSLRFRHGLWFGKLQLTIDEKNLQIVEIKFFPDDVKNKTPKELDLLLISTNNSLVDKPLNINILNFLQDPIITNKTTINYLLKFELSKYAKDIVSLDETSKAIRLLTVLSAITDIVDVFFDDEESKMSTFFVDNHYPKIFSIDAPDLDIQSCVTNTAKRVKKLAKNKLADQKLVYEELKKKAEQERPFLESDAFSKALRNLDVVKDQNIALLTGRRKPLSSDPVEQFSEFLEAARALDLFRFLKEAAFCAIKKVSPQAYRDLMQTYAKARKQLEKVLLATVCNPVLGKALSSIESFQLPEIATYDPNKTLSDALAKYVQQLLNDLIAEAIKQALTAAAKACLDSSPSTNPANTNTPNLLDGIDDNAGLNDPAINDLLSDLLDGLKDENGIVVDQAKLDALNNLKSVLDDVSKCLTPQELCRLMKGQTLNNDVYEIIASLLKRKFKGKDVSILYKLNDKTYLTQFFRTLGSILDLTICDFEDDPVASSKNPLCADETFETARREILKNKNLSDDAIDALLNDIKEKDKQNLEELLNFLDNDNPIDNTNLPNILCAKLPNGESIAPTVKAFSQLNDSLYKNIYRSFDVDASEWYTSTYTLEKKQLNFFKFGPDTNYRLRPDFSTLTGETSNTENNKAFSTANSTADESSIIDGLNKSKNYQETKLLNYLYNFTNTQISIDNSKNSFNTILDGFKQQEKDINIIDKQFRESVENAEIATTKFIKTFLLQLDTTIANDNNITNALRNAISLNITELVLLLATYVKSSTAETNDPNELKDLFNILDDKIRLDNAFFANAEGIPIYLRVMNYIKLNKSAIENIIKAITSSSQTISTLTAAGAQGNQVSSIGGLINNNTDSSNTGAQIEEKLKTLLNSSIVKYDIVQKYYETINNLKVTYPKFEISFLTSVDSLQFPYYDSEIIQYFNNSNKKPNKINVDVYKNGVLYDISFLNIKKNGKNHINIFNSDKVDDQIKNYIEQEMQFSFENYFNNSGNFLKPLVTLPNIQIPSKSLFINSNNTPETTEAAIIEETTVEQITKNTRNIKKELFSRFIINKVNNDINNLVLSNEIDNRGTIFNNIDTTKLKLNILQSLKAYNDVAYAQINTNIYEQIVNSCKEKSKFNSFIESFESTTEKPSFLSGPAFNNSNSATSVTGTPTTKYLNLVLEPTLHEKLCNKIPHFLDIDSIKEEMAQKKQKNNCVDNFINDKINKNEPINTNELIEQDNTESQNIMLDGALQLALRIHLTDIILRSSVIYGFFDPQSNRDESLFIDYVSDILESELRSEDALFYNLFIDHLFKQFLRENKKYISDSIKDSLQKRKLLRNAINLELRNFILPKLAKRIDKDTNINIIQKYGANNQLLINFKNIYSLLEPIDLNSENNWNDNFKIINNIVYFNYSSKNNLPLSGVYIKIFTSSFSTKTDVWNEFKNSIEYKFLFKYIFPIEKYFSHNFIIANLATSTKKQFTQPFKTTKTNIRQLCKLIKSRGQTIVPDANSAQDLFNLDPTELIRQFIINALIKAPLKIFKGYMETSEPNIAVASGVYKAIKIFNNDVPDVMIPALSVGLAVPSPAPLIPYFNYLGVGLYFGLGLWAEEKEEKKSNNSSNALNNILNNQVDCDTLPKRDIVTKNTQNLYDPAGSTAALSSAGIKVISISEEAKKMLQEYNQRNVALITVEQYNSNNSIINNFTDKNLSEDLLILLGKEAYIDTIEIETTQRYNFSGGQLLLDLWTKLNKPPLLDWYKSNNEKYLNSYKTYYENTFDKEKNAYSEKHTTQEYKDAIYNRNVLLRDLIKDLEGRVSNSIQFIDDNPNDSYVPTARQNILQWQREIIVYNAELKDNESTINDPTFITQKEINEALQTTNLIINTQRPDLSTIYNYLIEHTYKQPEEFKTFLKEKYKNEIAGGTLTFVE